MTEEREQLRATLALIEGAKRVIGAIKAQSGPETTDYVLFEVFMIAAGICYADARFPQLPDERQVKAAGTFFACGVNVGRAERTKTEKESCQGAA